MQDAVAILLDQAVQQGALPRLEGILINEAPIALVEIERLLTRNRIMGITVPCDQAKLG